MSAISAKDVKALRDLTGAGMMDCKRALQETAGDTDAAVDWLREKGIAGAAKGLPAGSILLFPALFTAGMALIDTADSLLMLGAYGWAVRQPQRRELRASGRFPELLTRSLAQKRDGTAMRRHDLVVRDARGAQSLLYAAARVDLGAAVVAIADVER